MVTHIDAEQSSHPVEIIGVIGHTQHLGYDGVLSPLGSKLLHQLHKVTGGCLTDSIHWEKKKKKSMITLCAMDLNMNACF